MAQSEQANTKTTNNLPNRNHIIVRTSVIGIAVNVLLAGFKAVIGVISGSIAITLDAVNNLSDALSSLITIIGTKLAGKLPDKKHPLGYGRMEYLSAMIVSAIMLYAGITSSIESIKKILNPVVAEYSTVSLIIVAVAIIVKLILGQYVKGQGERVHSVALVASGTEARLDAVLSASALASALIFLFFGLSLEAYVGLLISLMIIKSGVESMSETLHDILGKRVDEESATLIKELIAQEPEVYGAYDLSMHNYGANHNYASVHLELPDTMTVAEADLLTRRLRDRVYRETGVLLEGVSVYSRNTQDPDVVAVRDTIYETVLAHEWVLEIHGFYANLQSKRVRFDVIISFDMDTKSGLEIIQDEVQALYPEYTFYITPDADTSN